ncbi:MAG: DUF4149 domain-containing protein [Epsilonproteobacteria bacterium]|nr:DUF4149 domain-containing protein [Campylobacterota bacterium]
MQIPKTLTVIYLIILGITLGAGLYAGVVVAPVTFHSELYLGSEILSRFQEGLIMSENFARLGYLVTFTVLIVTLYEGYKYKMFQRDTTVSIAAFLVLTSGLLYAHYYIPQILEMQKEGESITTSSTFENLHYASELDFKLFALSLLVLLGRNLYLNLHPRT